MYRRELLITAGALVAFGLWLSSWSFSITTGGSFGSNPRSHECGTTIGIVLEDEYSAGIEGTFKRRRCWEEAKQRVARFAFLGLIALGLAITGLVRGPGPPRRSIDVLGPLPTPEEMEHSWVGDPARWP